ncbi:hypothetical protein DUI87_02114 [Hirundo rustica rustica]|uniref:Uncharacterized protein n=1 Tax=Hirundo rustica rustica TaxID=333673 RepID=A0A3M0LBJ2_HIRRU|nr:hypothetical protein DUI87_02114 [Hirundo rustica rustica]
MQSADKGGDIAGGDSRAGGRPGSGSATRRTLMTQATGSSTVQNIFASRSAGGGRTRKYRAEYYKPQKSQQLVQAQARQGQEEARGAILSGAGQILMTRERGRDTPSDTAGPGQAGAGRAETERAGTGRGRGGECLQGATPRQQRLRSPTPPISSLDSEPPARGDSETAAEILRTGARPKISQILQAFPELKRYLRTPSPQRPDVSVPSSPRGGAERQRARRQSIASTEASVWEDTPTLHRFFPISYKKSTSSEQQFKQKPREPLLRMRDDDAVEGDQEMSITDEDIIRITASEGIPVRRAKALEFTRQASSFLLSEDFMKQFFRKFTETASEFQHDPMSSFSQIFLPRKEAAEKFGDAQQTLISIQ